MTIWMMSKMTTWKTSKIMTTKLKATTHEKMMTMKNMGRNLRMQQWDIL